MLVAIDDLRVFRSSDFTVTLTPAEAALLAFLLFNAIPDGVDDDDKDDMAALIDGLMFKVQNG